MTIQKRFPVDETLPNSRLQAMKKLLGMEQSPADPKAADRAGELLKQTEPR